LSIAIHHSSFIVHSSSGQFEERFDVPPSLDANASFIVQVPTIDFFVVLYSLFFLTECNQLMMGCGRSLFFFVVVVVVVVVVVDRCVFASR
jgi:hypothetical protein